MIRSRNALRLIFIWGIFGAGHGAMAQNSGYLPPSGSAYVSDYLHADFGWGGEAASAVACGFRSAAWGATFHARLLTLLETHAGSPLQSTSASGVVSNTAHVPSAAEQAAALADLTNTENLGTKAANQPSAQSSDPTSTCSIAQQSLPDLDAYENGTNPLWPPDGN